MLELLLLMVSAGVHAAAPDDAPVAAVPSVVAESVATTPVEPEAQAAPSFLAPKAEEQAAAPSFLAPKAEEQAAAPSFLTPKAEEQAAAPSFLAPKAEEPTATPPAFLGQQAATPAPATPGGLQAEPQVPTGRFTTAIEVKPILAATRNAWINVREYGGQDLLYVTHLWSWRCGLLEMRVGINGNPPELWPLPPCHMEQPMPSAILESDGLPYRQYPLQSVHLIEIVLTYDDLTTEAVKFSRMGMPLP